MDYVEERQTLMPSGEDESVLAHLGPVTWSPQDGVAYEVALEGINQIIGAYSGLIGREKAAEVPDTAAITSWTAAMTQWAKIQEELSPADRADVERVRAACAMHLKELRAGHGR